MGFLDRLRGSARGSAVPAAPSTKPRGSSGRGHYRGFLELDERNPELMGLRGLEVFDEMYRTDPDVRRAIAMVVNPILGGTWSVEPHGGDEARPIDRQCADFVKWALTEHMRPRLTAHLAQALPVLLRSGFSPFEQVWELAEWQGKQVLVPRTLGLRLPRTIQEWPQDEFGDLEAIVQFVPIGAQGGAVEIPAQDLVYYRIGAEGDNWEGTSILRPAYKPWRIKNEVETLDAIGHEREAVGVPVVYPPDSSTIGDEVIDDLEKKLGRFNTGEQGYFIMPGPRADHVDGTDGWWLEIVGLGGKEGGRKPHPTLDYHSTKIAAVVVAEFMRLGQQQVGARATADVQQDPFLAGVEAITSIPEDTLNESLVARLAELNFDVESPPKLQMSLVDATTLTELKEFVVGLVRVGALSADHELEDFLRQQADLPAADPEAREQREAVQEQLGETPAPGPEGGGEQLERAAARRDAKNDDGDPTQLSRQERPLRAWEEACELDTIEDAIDSARERFVAAGGPAARQLAAELAERGGRAGDARPKVPDALVDAIYDELAALYDSGRTTVRRELERQGREGYADPHALAEGDRRPSLLRRARLAAHAVVSRVAIEIARLALRGGADRGEMQAAGEREAGAALRAEALQHAASALNEGRADQADEDADLIRGAYYTSILDGNRCHGAPNRCAESDDDVLRPLDDPVRLLRKPPNRACAGGNRCRCIEVYRLKEEDPPSGGYVQS